MNSKQDIEPVSQRTFSVGQFVQLANGDVILMDSERNSYPLVSVNILTKDFSKGSGETSFPKPYVVDEDFQIVEVGATVFVMFPFGRENPVVIGAIQSFVNQEETWGELRIDTKHLSDKSEKVSKENSEYSRNFYSDKLIESFKGGTIARSAKSINDSAESYSVTADSELGLKGETVEIGGNDERPVDDVQFPNKGKEVNMYSSLINLGYSPNRIAEEEQLELDSMDEVDDPKYQELVLGRTTKKLLELFIEIVGDAIYMGNGVVVRMSEQAKLKLREQVYLKLPKILSAVSRTVSKPDIV